MTEDTSELRAEWADDEAPTKKRGIPKWVWFGCGGGCLLVVLAVAAVIMLTVGFVQKVADPEYAWEQLEVLLPYDERPEGYTPHGGGFMGQEQYVIIADSHPLQGQIIRVPNERGLEELFDPESRANRGIGGIGRISDAEESTITIQGRETRCLYFKAWLPESVREEDGIEGASIRVDLTGEGPIQMAMQFTAYGDQDQIEEQDVIDFLEPFDVWRNR